MRFVGEGAPYGAVVPLKELWWLLLGWLIDVAVAYWRYGGSCLCVVAPGMV